jgi:hypothetical protein
MPNETVDEIMFFVFFYWFKKPQLDSHYIPGISPLWYFIFPVYLHQHPTKYIYIHEMAGPHHFPWPVVTGLG